MTVQGAFSSHTFRTWLGCQVTTDWQDGNAYITLASSDAALSVPHRLDKLSIAPDPKKDAGINWETGNLTYTRT